MRSGPLHDDVSNVFGTKFDGKTLGIHLRKTTKKVPVRVVHPRYITARREWLDAKERKSLRIDGSESDLQYRCVDWFTVDMTAICF